VIFVLKTAIFLPVKTQIENRSAKFNSLITEHRFQARDDKWRGLLSPLLLKYTFKLK